MIDLYNQYQDRIRTGDLLEWRGNYLISRLIRFKTKQRVNHTSIVLRYMLEGTLIERRFIGEAVSCGFTQTLLSEKLNGYDGECYWLRLKPEYDNFRGLIAAEAIKLDGIPYDYWSIFRQLRRHVPINGDKLFCSEAIQMACVRAGLIGELFNEGIALAPGEMVKMGLHEEPIRVF